MRRVATAGALLAAVLQGAPALGSTCVTGRRGYNDYLALARDSDEVVVGTVTRTYWVETKERPEPEVTDLGDGNFLVGTVPIESFYLGFLQVVEAKEYLKRRGDTDAAMRPLRLWCSRPWGAPWGGLPEGPLHLIFVNRQTQHSMLTSDLRLYDPMKPAEGRVPLDPDGVAEAWGFCGCGALALDVSVDAGGHPQTPTELIERLRSDLAPKRQQAAEQPVAAPKKVEK